MEGKNEIVVMKASKWLALLIHLLIGSMETNLALGESKFRVGGIRQMHPGSHRINDLNISMRASICVVVST